MSIPIPLNVNLETGRGNFRVTKDLRSLSFRSVVPGGYASCQIGLDRPLDVDPVDVAYYGLLTVSDGRHGGVVWQGRLEDPSRGVGSDGRIWDIAAVGPSAHARDQTVPLIYVDGSLERWVESGSDNSGGQPSRTEDLNGAPVLRSFAPEGTTIASPWRTGWRYPLFQDTGQQFGRVRVGWDAGFTSVNWDVELRSRLDTGSETTRDTASASTSGGTLVWAISAASTHNVLELVLTRTSGSSTIGDSLVWAIFGAIAVRAMLLDAEGNNITSGYTANTVLASEVVNDLLGRLLTEFDGATADVDTTTTAIEQLAYPDGVTPADVLADLALFEPDHYWAAWERTVNDKFRFEYKQWPTTVAYEASADDGYASSGSAVELYNQVYVRWRDADGRIRTTLRTQTVPELDDAGLTRTGWVDLGDDLAALSDSVGGVAADTAGDNFLTEHATPPNAGQLTVARPIIDHDRARLVQPWEITPGKLIRVRGIQPRVDALNPGGRDGVTVFKVVGVNYDAGSASATLELDSQPLTVTHALARLPRVAPTRERRR